LGGALESDEAVGLAAGAGEAFAIGLEFGVATDGVEDGGEDGGGDGIARADEAVVHPLPFPAGGDDAGFAEICEVAGDLGLALAEDFDEVADAELATGDEVEQAQAGGIGESGEEGDQTVGLRDGVGGCGTAGHQDQSYMA
jgi:hypothetical protein